MKAQTVFEPAFSFFISCLLLCCFPCIIIVNERSVEKELHKKEDLWLREKKEKIKEGLSQKIESTMNAFLGMSSHLKYKIINASSNSIVLIKRLKLYYSIKFSLNK